MTNDTKLHPVSINILGKDYRIACSEDEQETLLLSAQELDEQMREIRDTGAVNGADRIAVMAALNLTHELRQSQSKSVPSKSSISVQLANLRHKIENVLENS
jgi:cell division protein ZapA